MSEHELRSPLGRAIGLGSAKEGVQHWWVQRLTAIALVPLTLWFVAGVIAHVSADRAEIVHWLHQPVPAVLLILLLVAGFWHAALGVQVVIEDYVRPHWLCLAGIILVKLAAAALATAGVFAVLRLALGG
jgi:succinate dehydrogenase / fumarate reductase, membrane anchor subunit